MEHKRNHITISDLDELTAEKIAGLPVGELCMLQEDLTAAAEELKRRSARLVAGLGVRYGRTDAERRREENKLTGILRFPDGSNHIVTSDADKTVKWDQPKLESILNRIDDGWSHFAKVEISVPEAKYAAALPSIRAILDEARTVIARPSKFVVGSRIPKGK